MIAAWGQAVVYIDDDNEDRFSRYQCTIIYKCLSFMMGNRQ